MHEQKWDGAFLDPNVIRVGTKTPSCVAIASRDAACGVRPMAL